MRNARSVARRTAPIAALLLCLLLAPPLDAQFADQAGHPAPTSASAGAQSVEHYQLGDDPRWAQPDFDDSRWPQAPSQGWAGPLFYSDGVMWMRMRVSIPVGATEPLAVRIVNSGTRPGAEEVYVNGRLIGAIGGVPPQGQPVYGAPSRVFEFPPGCAAPGSVAVVAVRLWYQPRVRRHSGREMSARGDAYEPTSLVATSVGPAAYLRLADRADFLSRLVGSIPDIALNTLLAMVGITLIVFWRWTRRRELAWCSALLIAYPLYEYFFVATDLGYLTVSAWLWTCLFQVLTVATMLVTVEFIWTVHDLRAPILRRGTHAAWIVFNAANLVVDLSLRSSLLVNTSLIVDTVAVQTFNAITIGVNLWILFVRRRNRVIAAAMVVVPVGAALAHMSVREHWLVGTIDISIFDVGSLLSGFAVGIMLIQRAVKAWREGNDLRIEFEAAREMQEQLVTAAPSVPGFAIESVYAPAQQVGGDFFLILPQPDASVLAIVGDVSGKGLRAAMTVSAIMGALRTMSTSAPAAILAALNRSLIGNLRGGFVTCCATRIGADGAVTLANAGHLAPYCGGEELTVDSGLPLGLTPDAVYEESHLKLDPGESLTFLSDGVVEAQSAGGELFGFDRARALSGQSADAIAEAAQRFGQADDITVVRVTLAGAEVLRA